MHEPSGESVPWFEEPTSNGLGQSSAPPMADDLETIVVDEDLVQKAQDLSDEFAASLLEDDEDFEVGRPAWIAPIALIGSCAVGFGALAAIWPTGDDPRPSPPKARVASVVAAPSAEAKPPVFYFEVEKLPTIVHPPTEAPSPSAVSPVRKRPRRMASAPGGDGRKGNRRISRAMRKGRRAFRAGSFRSSLGHYQRAARRAPKSSNAHFGVALASYELRRDQAAQASLSRVLELQPARPEAHLLLGVIYQDHDATVQSKKHYHRYLELAPKGPWAREVRAVLDRLGADGMELDGPGALR